jgi:formimidoylglutamate deiminase
VGKRGDGVLDAFLFAGDSAMVKEVWAAGRHVVRQGRHIHRAPIIEAYRKTMSALEKRL